MIAHILRAIMRQIELTGNSMDFETSEPTARDTPFATIPHLIILLKQIYQPGTKYATI